MMGAQRRGLRAGAGVWGAAVFVTAAVALGGCEPSEPVPMLTVYVLTSPDQDVPARATEYSITIHVEPPLTFDMPIPDSAASGTPAEFAFRLPGATGPTTATVRVTARDASGNPHGWGESVPVFLAPGHSEEVAVLVLRSGAFATGPAGMTLTEGRSLHSALTVFDQWMLAAGGTATDIVHSLELFDLRILKLHTRIAEMPAPRSRAAAVPVTPGQIMFLGGVLESAHADVFDASTGEFTAVPLPAGAPATWIDPRHAVLGDGSALVMGGFDGAGNPVDAIARVAAGVIEILEATTTRADPTVTPVETPAGLRALVYGGNVAGEPSAVLVDPVTGDEEPAGPIPDEARSRHTAVRYAPDKVMIAGGVDAAGTPATYVWLFDATCLHPDAGCVAWSTIGPALRPAPFMDGDGAAIEATEGDARVVFACGVDEADDPLPAASLIDGVSGIRNGRPLITPRSGCRILRLQNGQIVIVGGMDAAGEPLDTMEFFEPDPT